jgi:hypothetical protein
MVTSNSYNLSHFLILKRAQDKKVKVPIPSHRNGRDRREWVKIRENTFRSGNDPPTIHTFRKKLPAVIRFIIPTTVIPRPLVTIVVFLHPDGKSN